MSVFSFPDINFGFSQNLVYELILWRSALKLLMSKVCQVLSELSARIDPYFCFKKSPWIFTKHDMCIDIVEIWFGIFNGQISSICDRVICPWHDYDGVLLFQVFISLNLYFWLIQ